MSRKVLAAIQGHRKVAPLLSEGRVSVDATLVKAWASMKRYEPKDSPPPNGSGGPPSSQNDETSTGTSRPQQTETEPMPETSRQTRNADMRFRGEKRSNATQACTTDPDIRLCKKAPGVAHCLIWASENRNSPVVQADLTLADGHGGRKAELKMINRHVPAPDAWGGHGI